MPRETHVEPVVARVKARIAAQNLTLPEAAEQIGVTASSLERHLRGDYVRSDSLAKYRRWLDGVSATTQLLLVDEPPSRRPPDEREALAVKALTGWTAPARPFRVVDLFSGCGGMSLGFDVLGDGTAFRTVLGLDIEEPMVRAFNANFHSASKSPVPLARRVDLSDFRNDAEVLAFYLDHLAAVSEDAALRDELRVLPQGSLDDFKKRIHQLDREFLAAVGALRSGKDYLAEYAQLDGVTLGQTSVVGFHSALALPLPGARVPELPPIVWADTQASPSGDAVGESASPSKRVRKLKELWEAEVKQLEEKSEASGQGQLASSAKKIRAFVSFVRSEPMDKVRDAWALWRARRDELREDMFGTEEAREALRSLYTAERQANVILGGPPCQGFSRIGRGKIRSLREHGVHVQQDAEAGDERNRLLFKYTLFVAALRPDVFLFENVRHFQAEVKTPEGTFKAPDVLAEAIRDISEDGADYSVAMATVDCSRHLVPQTRERFVMAGIRTDVERAVNEKDLAAWMITLPTRPTLPLRVALDGLPDPVTIDGSPGALARTVSVRMKTSVPENARPYVTWIRQAHPGASGRGREVADIDGHVVRGVRADDQALFKLMGPGTRWMDYRCDESRTLQALRSVLEASLQAASALRKSGKKTPPGAEALAELEPEQLEWLVNAVDGSLSLRLLLESIPPLPGELGHHLLAPGYLSKREGKHGDWLARMDSERPSKTIVSHMAKDAYMYIHPTRPRALSVREAARIQTFPDWFSFGCLGLVDAFRVVGNAVPPLLGSQFAERVIQVLHAARARPEALSAG